MSCEANNEQDRWRVCILTKLKYLVRAVQLVTLIARLYNSVKKSQKTIFCVEVLSNKVEMSRTNETLTITPTPAAAAVQTSIFLLLMLAGVLGNGSICFFVFRFKSLRTIPNILLTNLATIDLLNIIINVPLSISSLIYDVKVLHTKAAALWTFLVTVLFVQLNLASMLLLVVDRYFALAYPVQYISRRTHSKTFRAIYAAWICCLFITGCFSIPLYDMELGGKSLRYYIIAYSTRISYKKYALLGIIIVMGVNIVVSSLTVRKVFRESLRKTAENKRHSLRSNAPRTKTSNAVKSVCTIMIVLLVYIVCFVGRISFTFVFLNSSEHSQLYIFLAQFCLFCGSTWNSFIYAVRSTEFRNAWRETFKFNKNSKNQVHDSQKKAGKVFYINDVFGKRVVITN